MSDILSSGKSKIGEIKKAFKGIGKKAAKEGAEEVVEETVEPVEVVEEPVKQSSWEKVQAILNEKGWLLVWHMLYCSLEV